MISFSDLILIGQGSFRKTYSVKGRPNIVIKITDANCNFEEHERYRKSFDPTHEFHNKLAQCRLMKNGWLVMKKVRCVEEQLTETEYTFKIKKNKFKINPNIENYNILKYRAVGLYKNKLVIYDYDKENITM